MSAGDWDRVSLKYDTAATRFTSLHAADLVSAVPQINTASQVLEIACGTGAFARAYLAAFPKGIPGQTITFTDFSPAMVKKTEEYVRSTIGEDFQGTVKFQVVDGRNMHMIQDDSVDVVVSVFGVFLIPEGVMSEIWRVLKTSGVFGSVAWTDLPSEVLPALEEAGLGYSYQQSVGAAFGSFLGDKRPGEKVQVWSDPIAAKSMMEEEKFGKVRVFRCVHSVGFPNLDYLWFMLNQNPYVDFSTLEQEKVDKAKEIVKDALKITHNFDETIFLMTVSNVVVGTKVIG